MKFIIFAGTPGSGKTSIIKHIIHELRDDFKLFFAKFDCLRTSDDEYISNEYKIPTIKKLAGELCPDHYTALEIPRIIKENQDKDIIILKLPVYVCVVLLTSKKDWELVFWILLQEILFAMDLF